MITKEPSDLLNDEVSQNEKKELLFHFDFEELFSIPTSIEVERRSQITEQENESANEVIHQSLNQTTDKDKLLNLISLSNYNQPVPINLDDIFTDVLNKPENNISNALQFIQLPFGLFETQFDVGLDALKQGLNAELNACI